jgi:hypothetical protein
MVAVRIVEPIDILEYRALGLTACVPTYLGQVLSLLLQAEFLKPIMYNYGKTMTLLMRFMPVLEDDRSGSLPTFAARDTKGRCRRIAETLQRSLSAHNDQI